MIRITTACLDLAGTTVTDDGVVLGACTAAVARAGLTPGSQAHASALEIMNQTMGQSMIEVFRRVLGSDAAAWQANRDFEEHYARSVLSGAVVPLPGAAETIMVLRAAGIRVCVVTGFGPVTRDLLVSALGWRPLIDLALSPADAGRGGPWPDLPLTALLRLGGGAVSELLVAGDTASDVESGLRAGAGLVAGVLTGAGGRQELAAAGAPHILDAITGLPALLGLGPDLSRPAQPESGEADQDRGQVR